MNKRHMHKTDRSLALLLALFLCLGTVFCACGTQGTPPPADTESKETEPVFSGEEYTLPLQDGYNQITFYFSYPEPLKNADIWSWWDGGDGKGYILYPSAYGAKAVINVPEGVEEVGFIVRRDCSEPGGSSWGSATKDYEQDRFAKIEGKETFIYLKSGDANQYHSQDGGKTLHMIQNFSLAAMTALNQISYTVTPKTCFDSISDFKVYLDGEEIGIKDVTELGRESTVGVITVDGTLDITKTYELEIKGFGKKTVIPTTVFDTKEFIENYTYDGDDLGAHIKGDETTFKVWAPTASRVVLDLFTEGNDTEAYKSVDMTRGERGVWSHSEPCGHGTYYTYTVTTAVGTQTATDPYAYAAGVNGDRSMVIDLSLTDPEAWEDDASFETGIDAYTDAVIWEVHVRDFSNRIASSKYKGKYLAFTETGLTNEAGIPVGVDYLKELGITHVHLLPVYDYATVDESDPDAAFNWGYDPKNYNVPEGSYATDPYHGEVRVKEFKEMVAALHGAGIGVIMDVVYNHTYDANSSFNRIVPYYYYRYTSTGANSSASGCGNDTASERCMFGKFMVDSVSYLAKEYHLDGFRFDLMGLHDLETMQEVERAVHAINGEAIIYGEGWTMGATIDGSAQANQGNISKIEVSEGAIGGIAVFNDAIRDGLKGSVFDKASHGYINGAAKANMIKVQFGIGGASTLGGGWIVERAESINYMSAHDNNTLWDKLLIANGEESEEARLKMNRLGAAIIMISRGIPFMQAGEEMLRSKGGDENSYKSSDAVNNIDWAVLTEDSNAYATMQYYKGLIAMRKAYPIFTQSEGVAVTFNDLGEGRMDVTFDGGNGNMALIVINPSTYPALYTPDASWTLVATETEANISAQATGEQISIDGYGIRVYVKTAD